MFEEIFVGIVEQENNLSTLGARRVLTEYKIPFDVLDENDLVHKINHYSLLLIDSSIKSNYIFEHMDSFLKSGGSIILYNTPCCPH